MPEEMKAKLDAARVGIKRHLELAHEGTALHAILSALDVILTPPEPMRELEPVEGEGE